MKLRQPFVYSLLFICSLLNKNFHHTRQVLACSYIIISHCALTGAWTRRGQIVYEVLQGPVFGQVEVITGGVLYLQPLPVAVGPLMVLIQEHAHQQQQTQQEQRPCDHSNKFHQPPCPTWAVASPQSRLSCNWGENNVWQWVHTQDWLYSITIYNELLRVL